MARDTLIGGVLAATDKVARQAEQGDWQSVTKTVEQRRMLLDALQRAEPQSGEHDFLKALRAAVTESEAAVDVMKKATVLPTSGASSSVAAKKGWTA
ncbi:MAG TPA: hypothetical protein VK629_04825 [Steroidobacteraceae bacterium]|nr:hypothetical protein [Steroidobacteraceae bacterium]